MNYDIAPQFLENWKTKVENENMSFNIELVQKALDKYPFEEWNHQKYWGLLLRLFKMGELDWLQGFEKLGLPLDPRSPDTGYESSWFVALEHSELSPALKWALDPHFSRVNINDHEGKFNEGQSALMYACRYGFNEHFNTIEWLLLNGAHLNHITPTGESVLSKLNEYFNSYQFKIDLNYKKEFEKLITLLFEHGLDIYTPSENGVAMIESIFLNDPFREIIQTLSAHYTKNNLNQIIPKSNHAKSLNRL